MFGLINRGIPLEPLLGGTGTQFDPQKMNWIGSPDRDTTVCAARKDAAVQAMHDLYTKELAVGATGSGADTAIYPEFLAELLGMKIQDDQGLSRARTRSSSRWSAARCRASASPTTPSARQRLAREGQINILFQAALEKDPSIPGDVPLALELAKSATERGALELFFARAALGPALRRPGRSAG